MSAQQLRLKSCPWCGGENLDTFETDGEDVAVACQDCWAWGPCVNCDEVEDDIAAHEEAMRRWSKRPVEEELLAACAAGRLLLFGMLSCEKGWGDYAVWPEDAEGKRVYDLIRAAIAKARGRT